MDIIIGIINENNNSVPTYRGDKEGQGRPSQVFSPMFNVVLLYFVIFGLTQEA